MVGEPVAAGSRVGAGQQVDMIRRQRPVGYGGGGVRHRPQGAGPADLGLRRSHRQGGFSGQAGGGGAAAVVGPHDAGVPGRDPLGPHGGEPGVVALQADDQLVEFAVGEVGGVEVEEFVDGRVEGFEVGCPHAPNSIEQVYESQVVSRNFFAAEPVLKRPQRRRPRPRATVAGSTAVGRQHDLHTGGHDTPRRSPLARPYRATPRRSLAVSMALRTRTGRHRASRCRRQYQPIAGRACDGGGADGQDEPGSSCIPG